MRCPHCGSLVVFEAGDGRVKIRTKMLILEKGSAITVCSKCGGDVPLDVEPGEEIQKSFERRKVRLVVPRLTHLKTARKV